MIKKKHESIDEITGGVILGDSKTATVISESEWAWDREGEEPRGLGDYRVPKDMLSDLDGNPRTRASLAPKLGEVILNLTFLYLFVSTLKDCMIDISNLILHADSNRIVPRQ